MIKSLIGKTPDGDFAKIKERGKGHLAFALIAMISVVALSALMINYMHHFIPGIKI